MPAPASHPVLVGLLGGECTGKTSLALELADRLPGAALVPEALRQFVAERGRAPHSEEQREIMDAQRAAEDRALASGSPLVIGDPASLMTAVYSQLYFDDGGLMPQAREDLARYRLLLWCAPDIPWEPDGAQRDGEPMRTAADALIATMLADFQAPAVRIGGDASARLERAVHAIRAVASG